MGKRKLFSFAAKDKKLETLVTIDSSKVSHKDHSDVHYLYKQRKALSLLVGEEGLKGYTVEDIRSIHEAIVRALIDNDKTHYYDTWDSELDDYLPQDLKDSSDGYYKKEGGMFDLEDEKAFAEDEHYESEYKIFLEEAGAIELWEAPKKRSEVPAGHFLDSKNKRYPFKNKDGSINCTGLKTAMAYANGARGAPKRPEIAAKAKRIYSKNCAKKKAQESFGKMTKI